MAESWFSFDSERRKSATYAVLENGLFEIKDFDGNVVKSIQL